MFSNDLLYIVHLPRMKITPDEQIVTRNLFEGLRKSFSDKTLMEFPVKLVGCWKMVALIAFVESGLLRGVSICYS